MKRSIVIVLDGVGAGVAPDAAEFGNSDCPSTLLHVSQVAGPIAAPILAGCGFLAAGEIPSAIGLPGFHCEWGRLEPKSKAGKDSVTGHWEMMGITLPSAFPTYPGGFPPGLVSEFEERIGRKVIGNKPASGTAIIAELGAEHVRTGQPILYTSADSVFQVAVHEEVVPIETLYEWCCIARELCVGENAVQRVIARPFLGSESEGWTRTDRRKDFPLTPPPNLVDQIADVYGIGVVPELFGGRGFRPVRRTQNNEEHEVMLREALSSDARFIFANFEDFDMRFGHRNDPDGFARCLERFDHTLKWVLEALDDETVLILTADHGNDPTTESTDHSREFVPFVQITRGNGHRALGNRPGFHEVGLAVARWLDISES